MPNEKPKKNWLLIFAVIVGALVLLSPVLKVAYYFVKAYLSAFFGAL